MDIYIKIQWLPGCQDTVLFPSLEGNLVRDTCLRKDVNFFLEDSEDWDAYNIYYISFHFISFG